MSYDRKHKLEYHLASAHNKIDTKLSQNQELVNPQQPRIEYFQEVRERMYILFQSHHVHTKKTNLTPYCILS